MCGHFDFTLGPPCPFLSFCKIPPDRSSINSLPLPPPSSLFPPSPPSPSLLHSQPQKPPYCIPHTPASKVSRGGSAPITLSHPLHSSGHTLCAPLYSTPSTSIPPSGRPLFTDTVSSSFPSLALAVLPSHWPTPPFSQPPGALPADDSVPFQPAHSPPLSLQIERKAITTPPSYQSNLHG